MTTIQIAAIVLLLQAFGVAPATVQQIEGYLQPQPVVQQVVTPAPVGDTGVPSFGSLPQSTSTPCADGTYSYETSPSDNIHKTHVDITFTVAPGCIVDQSTKWTLQGHSNPVYNVKGSTLGDSNRGPYNEYANTEYNNSVWEYHNDVWTDTYTLTIGTSSTTVVAQ